MIEQSHRPRFFIGGAADHKNNHVLRSKRSINTGFAAFLLQDDMPLQTCVGPRGLQKCVAVLLQFSFEKIFQRLG